jgi:hypothetical protein
MIFRKFCSLGVGTGLYDRHNQPISLLPLASHLRVVEINEKPHPLIRFVGAIYTKSSYK